MKKHAIVLLSFGSANADIRRTVLDACACKIRAAFPAYDVHQAFTSPRIRKLLQERDGICVPSLQEILQHLSSNGATDVIVQPLQIIPGLEFHESVFLVNTFSGQFQRIALGLPLLASPADYQAVAASMKELLPPRQTAEAVVFMGHGTRHPAHAAYLAIERICSDIGLTNVFVGTIDTYPTLDHILPKLRSQNITHVHLMPFFIISGTHARQDMAGDHAESWKSRLQQAGFQVTVSLRGLGENPAIQDIYVQHIRDTLID